MLTDRGESPQANHRLQAFWYGLEPSARSGVWIERKDTTVIRLEWHQMTFAPGDFGYQEAIPEPMRQVFAHLCQDLAALCAKWATYEKLFGNPEALALVNATAPAAFSVLEESLRADMTMSICRLADPMRQGGNDNLTIATLVDGLPSDHPAQLVASDFHEATRPIDRHRNKAVAHNDLHVALNPAANPLPGVGPEAVVGILQLASRLLNLVSGHFGGAGVAFDLPSVGDARSLLHWLQRGWTEHEREMRDLGLRG
jgi:hypothetical protein